MPIMDICDLWDLRYYVNMLCCYVFLDLWVLLWLYGILFGMIGLFMSMHYVSIMLLYSSEWFWTHVVNSDRWNFSLLY